MSTKWNGVSECRYTLKFCHPNRSKVRLYGKNLHYVVTHLTCKMCTKNSFYFVVDKYLLDFLTATQYMLPNTDFFFFF